MSLFILPKQEASKWLPWYVTMHCQQQSRDQIAAWAGSPLQHPELSSSDWSGHTTLFDFSSVGKDLLYQMEFHFPG